MKHPEKQRVAWLLPAMGTGGISFQHLLCEFTKIFPNTVTFTGQWPGYAPGFKDTFAVQEVGATRYIEFGKTANGYTIGFSYASPQIVKRLLQFKPQVIFANAFTAWTAIALLLKPIGRWKVIITYEGGSSTYESPSASIRYQARRFMALLADAFVVNSRSGKAYLLDVLKVKSEIVFARPFLVPSTKALLYDSEPLDLEQKFQVTRPVFLFVGQIVPRKGLQTLLEACVILKSRGYTNYTLLVVGDGEQRQELEVYIQDSNISEQVKWIGKVPYGQLGSYFQQADVFVFPTHEDIWGMVLVEAMAFGKPVICSKEAGAVEMVANLENGFIFSPKQPEELAEHMGKFIGNKTLIKVMSDKSMQIMDCHSLADATKTFYESIEFIAK